MSSPVYQTTVHCDGTLLNLDAVQTLQSNSASIYSSTQKYAPSGSTIALCVPASGTTGQWQIEGAVDLSSAGLGLFFTAGFTIIATSFLIGKSFSLVIKMFK
jgi:hypothetical protein